MSAGTATVGDARGVVLYDGVCGLCNRSVRWMIDRDPERRLAYAPLQGETAAELRAKYPRIPAALASVVFVEAGRVWLRAAAAFAIIGHLHTPLRHLAWLRHVGWLFDPGYWFITKVRYRVFGRYEACRVPSTAERAQLLP